MSLVVVLAMMTSIAGNHVPYDQIETIAERWGAREWSDMSIVRVLTYYSFDGEVTGYAFIFSKKTMPPDEILIKEIIEDRGRRPRNRYGVDDYATVVMSSRRSEVPIFQFYRGLPDYYSIRRYLPQRFDNLKALKVYYYSPGEEWIEFEGGLLVKAYSGQVYDKDEFLKGFTPQRPHAGVEKLTDKMWQELRSGDFATQDSNKIPDMVPFYEWHYGCSPTASSMLLGYWDTRGYAKLVDFFYGPCYSYPENAWDDGIANCQRELALAMNTDTLTGGTSIYNIHTGQLAVCNGYNNNYNFQ
ncbi:MAG TPA: hypothetical protein EYP24_01195, partial [bacterium (Candidatus Stahlbacteria)]|nr:hypothetical protein [Candidatus Stahlbacteria bacterium]